VAALLEEPEEQASDLMALHGGLVYRRMVSGQERDPAAGGDAVPAGRGETSVQVGVDVGGTFTDVVAFDPATGDMRVAKVPSTPADQARGVLDGLAALGLDASQLARFAHGTTVATNAVLERRGARTALVVTEGFRDLLEIARQNRPSLYDLFVDRPPPLVPRELVVEAPERVAVGGSIVRHLDESGAAAVADAVAALQPQSVAICLLHSFTEPGHERAIQEAIGRVSPDGSDPPNVSASVDVLPVFREYERASTTALNAYVAPAMRRYLGHLEGRLRDGGIRVPVEVMRSGGGTFDAAAAADLPVHTLLSGPAAGAWGAAATARSAGIGDVIAFDMGGTSTDVALVEGGAPGRTAEGSIGGLPFGVATTDIHTVGAGGGSIAWRDDGGALRVGPHSAGADPGPACYGKGGTEPTVTDALLVLGMLDPDTPLGGSIALRPDPAVVAVASLGRRLGLDLTSCAAGIIRVVQAQIERALRVVSVERGRDPRAYTLLPFGGAGPLLQGRLAQALGCERVLIPRSPGVLSAIGLLTAPPAVDLARTRLTDLADAAPDDLDRVWGDLERESANHLATQGVSVARSRRSADCRYRGQAFEIEVDAPAADPQAIAAAFHAAHRERYGFHQADQSVEVVTLRVRAEGTPPRFSPPMVPEGSGSADTASLGRRRILLDGEEAELPVLRREALEAGDRIEGPALLVGADSTCLVLPGQHGTVDAFGSLLLRDGS
jgi:N-methylhydantoinase A